MTKVMCDVNDYGLMFDCMNHSDDHDVCTVVSTLCNVLVAGCERFDKDFEPTAYSKGHVRIDLRMIDDIRLELFNTVMRVMEELERQHPKHVKIY